MALFENTIFSGIRGSIDTVTFYRRKGKTYVRRKIMRRKAPTTPAQTKNETRFGRFQKTVKAFKEIIHLGFSDKDGSRRKGRFNSLNLQHLKLLNGLECLDYSSLQVSEGSLEKLSDLRLQTKGRTIFLSWKVEEEVAIEQKTIICIFNQTRHKAIYTEVLSTSGQAEYTLPEDWEKKDCHIYLFSMLGNKRSDSRYLSFYSFSLRVSKDFLKIPFRKSIVSLRSIKETSQFFGTSFVFYGHQTKESHKTGWKDIVFSGLAL
ncbi:MAG: hypothetical protein H7A25_06315 [Leptospiraceae bacterium]|nr:hypothetical protein [Leptospiraceae bacterium]MCP5499498.1 hypothetical protein [Leptospiraceae bacterium]